MLVARPCLCEGVSTNRDVFESITALPTEIVQRLLQQVQLVVLERGHVYRLLKVGAFLLKEDAKFPAPMEYYSVA